VRPNSDEEIHSIDEGVAWVRRILNLERPPMFPMLIDIEGRDVLVVGGGKIALRRVKTLLKCGASIRVVSPELNPGFDSVKDKIKVFKRKFEIKDLDNAMLAVAASDDREANKSVGLEARARNIPVSVADAIAECTFFFPALIASGAASVSVSTAGTSYHTTKRLADRLRSVWARWVAEESESDSESVSERPAKKIRIGSRASALAVAQSNLIIEAITQAHPELEVELIIMQTTGDVNMKPFADITDPTGIKGLFTLELENALLNGDIDLAIHSLKDVPMKLNEKLPIVAYSKREDPRDALVINNPDGNVIGCSSLRRRLQLAKIFPDKKVVAVRGNIQTRLKKLESGEFDMLVLAASGLKRLGLGNKISKYFEASEMIPSAGQGVLACQGRAGEDYYYLDAIIDKEAQDCAIAERAFATALGGGCTQPVAAHAVIKDNNNLELTGLYIEMRGNNADGENIYHKKVLTGPRSDAETIGRNLAAQIMREFKY
ncbi:MAG: hydroxymethylbilane synthase, partial [Synergistaceae bacterium]|nr:hydroxymethylbilane synthase [Synergistaceae bacterium]